MITVTTRDGETVRVDFAVNRGRWFGKTWLVTIVHGYMGLRFLVEADCESDAIDEIVDSRHKKELTTEDLCEVCEEQNKLCEDLRCYDACSCSFAGNYGERINPEVIFGIERCSVNYFAKGEKE